MKLDFALSLKRNGSTFFSFLVVLYVFFTFWLICSIDSTLYAPAASSVKKILATLVPVMWILFLIQGSIKIDKKSLIFCLFPIFYYLISYFNHYDDDHFQSLFGIFSLLIVLAVDTPTKAIIFVIFKKMLVGISVLGIICYIAYFIHLPLPHISVPYYGEDNWNYIYYYIAALCDTDGQIRLCGLFNEPGYLGTILGIILSVEELIFKKNENKVLIIAGLLTFSLAFYLTLVLCYILKNINKKSHLIGIILLVLSYLYVLPNIHTGSPMIDKVIERVQIKDNKLVGDNRSNASLDWLLATTMISNNSVWGQGMGYVASFNLNISSYKAIIIDCGLAGFFILYICFIICLIYKNRHDKNALLVIIMFSINIYQRPYIYSMVYFVVLFGGLAFIESRKMIENDSSYNRNSLNF